MKIIMITNFGIDKIKSNITDAAVAQHIIECELQVFKRSDCTFIMMTRTAKFNDTNVTL